MLSIRDIRNKITEASSLPERISRPMAARFAQLDPKTLRRAELRGELTPFYRNSRVVSYDRDQFLKWLGIID